MKIVIIEDSNIVKWENFPEYICAIKGTIIKPLKNGRTLERIEVGTRFTWLMDKPPIIDGEDITITNTEINGMGGIYTEVGDAIEFNELHFKPRPKPNLKVSTKVNEYLEEML